MKKILHRIKNINIPVKIIGIVLILAIGLVIWKPGIVRGEFNIQAIFDRLTQHDKKINDLEKKVDETTTLPAVQPAVTTPAPTPAKVPTTNTESYVSSVCTYTDIPYETVYENDPSLDIGLTQVSSFGGDGYVKECTTSSTGFKLPDGVVKPINKVVHVGTRQSQPVGPSTEELRLIREEKIAKCVSQVNAAFQIGNSRSSSAYTSAIQQCGSIQ